ncbi:MAG TPA: histidine phosphatase family protein [Burkholderiales bacterium]|nr:histidine phosphatase family protein [Burkholderiales bacterium]
MDLILWRHADAESGIPDEERRLTARGHDQAQRTAAWLKPRLPGATIVRTSPARRAQETARALTDAFEVCPEIATLATPVAILEAAGWPDAPGAVVVVGHQPTLGQALALAITGRVADFHLENGALCWLAREGRRTRVRALLPPDLI